MTDKQMIIDEVKCPWFNDGSCDLFYSDKEECWYRKCKDTPKCYYRETQTQLKRKEQKLNDYKKQVKADTKEMEDYQNEIVRHLESIEYWQHQAETKEQECEELKKETERWKSNFNGKVSAIEELLQQLDQLKAENEELKKTVMQKCPQCGEIYLNPIGAKLYEALTEIKEIAERGFKHSQCNCGAKADLDLILQKISEVEDG